MCSRDHGTDVRMGERVVSPWENSGVPVGRGSHGVPPGTHMRVWKIQKFPKPSDPLTLTCSCGHGSGVRTACARRKGIPARNQWCPRGWGTHGVPPDTRVRVGKIQKFSRPSDTQTFMCSCAHGTGVRMGVRVVSPKGISDVPTRNQWCPRRVGHAWRTPWHSLTSEDEAFGHPPRKHRGGAQTAVAWHNHLRRELLPKEE